MFLIGIFNFMSTHIYIIHIDFIISQKRGIPTHDLPDGDK